jgi:transglutaminase-like putative cysteine protease
MTRLRIVLACVVLLSLARSERIKLFDGRVLRSDSLLYRDGTLLLEDTTVRKGDVKSILFETEAEERPLWTSASDVRDVLEEAREAASVYPDAGGIVLLDHGEFTWNGDGTESFTYHYRAKVLKPERRDWANVSIRFEEERERVRLLSARTIKHDGRVVLLDESGVKVQKRARGAVFFDTDQYFTFTLPQVAVGDVIEYKYEVETFNPWNPNFFTAGFYFRSDEPFWLSRMDVTVPIWDPLNYKALRMPEDAEQPRVTKGSESVTYTWEVSRMDPLVEEPRMPPRGDVYPRVTVSNYEDWEPLLAWYADFQRRRIGITPEIRTLAERIAGDAGNESERVARLYHWVQREIRYISIKMGAASGMSGHPAEETLRNGYGDCTDVAILFATMLRAVGVDAYPVYVGTNDDSGDLILEVPSWYGNHCINQIDFQSGETIYLDATGTTSRYPSFWSADHGVYAVNAIKRQIERIPVPAPEGNARTYEYGIWLDPEGNARVVFQSRYVGEWEDGVRWHWENVKEDQREFLFNNMIHEISPDAELLSYELSNVTDISKPFSMRLEFALGNYATRAGDLMIFRLPEMADRLSFDEVGLERREHDLAYSTTMQIVHRFEVTLPEGLQVEYMPAPLRLSGSHADYEASYELEGSVLRFQDRFRRKSRIVPSEDYPEYQEILRLVSSYAEEKVFLRRGD